MKTKIDRGWYQYGHYHIVLTYHYGGDRNRDWVVTRSEEQARKIHSAAQHANPLDSRYTVSLCDVDAVYNRLSDAIVALHCKAARSQA
jgi:hypothetical protein